MKLCRFIPAFGLLLAACQTSSPSEISSSSQVQQLSALVASASWLRDNCARADIPAQSKLIEVAIKQGQKRGWDMRKITVQDVQTASTQRYNALSEDTQPKDQKCAALNNSAAPFLRNIN
ncbi:MULTISPECIES: type II secretion system pilot lipoprotein GspS [Enterobacterales]|uniref:type II secretion system pilot lipoprotein GspS n=1 Tax=Enterobacterales TaxID=91347 RepID=UPI000E0F2841|nr:MULTISPECIES: type II secretion system pilot lipoprotein GspS [Enterobacterales]RDK12989.1 hypothetical protein CEJ32_20165 [Enterobacter sp. 9-2]